MKKVLSIIAIILVFSPNFDLRSANNSKSINNDTLVINNNEELKEEKPIKPFQFSILPTISTDGSDVINYRYNLSINAFMGLTGGVQGLEAGYFMNINRGHVDGLQLAGFGNIVHGESEGLQASGFMNIVHGHVTGVRGSGFMNIISGDAEGVIGSGFLNVTGGNSRIVTVSGFANYNRGDFFGLAGAGFMNYFGGTVEGVTAAGFANFHNDLAEGIHIAGFGNYTRADMDGLQIAGFMNASKDVHGAQGAGFGNYARGNLSGTQIAGFMNSARHVKGGQLSGFLNIAKEVEGGQVGFINICDTITGVPVGFLSVVRRGGLRQFELSVSDAMLSAISYKIGVYRFYNIFSLGFSPFIDKAGWGIGYGLGTNINLSDQNTLQLEGHTFNIQGEYQWWDRFVFNNLNELRIIYSHNLNPNFQLFAGPVFYNQIIKNNDSHPVDDLSVAPYTFYEKTWGDHTYHNWIGARGGIRFILR